MRTTKRFSNTTFTKRVDHVEAQHQPDEPSVCKACGAIYTKRRWVTKKQAQKSVGRAVERPTHQILCQACAQKAEGVPGGYVYLDGAFFVKHREEVERLLQNEAKRVLAKNPLAQIMEWQSVGEEKMTITTTTEHLAQRLGHALEKAFSGSVVYDFSHENKLARVHWHRD
jgi:hypothetical protein